MPSRRANVGQRRRILCLHRRAISALVVVTALVLVAVVTCAIWYLGPWRLWAEKDAGMLLHTVSTAPFSYIVTERGEVESSSNREVRCEVQARNSSGTMLLEIVPEGTYVNEGDFIARFDDSALRQELTQQQIVVSTNEAVMKQSQGLYDTAVTAKEEYLEATFKQEEELIESERFVAEENVRKAQEWAKHSEFLFSRGYITLVQLEADRFAVDKAAKELDVANTKLDGLRNYTRKKMIQQLEADIDSAEAKLEADKTAYELEVSKLKLIEEQIAKCVAKAPAAGQVVYANDNNRRGGEDIIIEAGVLIRENQVLVRLPDPKRMQVQAKINEARIDMVRVGMRARVRVDAFPDMDLRGEVTKVDDFPLSSSSWFNSVKEYGTTIRVFDPPDGLRPGMTAEVRIFVEQLPSALQVPVQVVVERSGKHFCLVKGDNGELSTRELLLGTTNDKFVVVRDGLVADEQVLFNPRAFLDRVDLPAAEAMPDETMLAEDAPVAADGVAPNFDDNHSTDPPRAAGPGGAPGRGPGDRPGGGMAGDPAAMAGMMIQRFDTDGDGKLSEQEMPEGGRAGFSATDANGDGFVDAAEMAAGMARFRGGRGRRAPGDGNSGAANDTPAATGAETQSAGDGGGGG